MSDNDFNPFMDEEDDLEDRRIAEMPVMSAEEASERYVPGQGLSSSRLLDLEDEIDLDRVRPRDDGLPSFQGSSAEVSPNSFNELEPESIELQEPFSPLQDEVIKEPSTESLEPAWEEPAEPWVDPSPAKETIENSPFSMGTVGLTGQSAEEFIASISEDDEGGNFPPSKKGKKRDKPVEYDGVSEDYNFENPAKTEKAKIQLTPREKALKAAKAPLIPLVLMGKPFSILLRPVISGPRTLQAVSSAVAILFIMGLIGVYGGVMLPGTTTTVSPAGNQATLTDFRLNGGVASATFTNDSDEVVKGSPSFEVHGRKLGLNIKAFLIPPVVGTCQSQPVTVSPGDTVEVTATCDANIDGVLKQVVGDFKWM